VTDGPASTAAPAIHSESGSLTRAQLQSDILGFRAQIEQGGRARLSTSDAGVIAAALTALDGWAAEVHLIPPDVTPASVAADVTLLTHGGATTSASPPPTTTQATRWVLYTSGTTGEPKPISHSLGSLTRTVAVSSAPYVWGLTYDPNRMAGIQVILQALQGGTLVVPPSEARLPTRIAHLVSSNVNAVSATPSVWRQVLQLPVARDWPLHQITLGGEIADQRILDALATAFPTARIVHVFASTETGAAFSVKDRREGFPVSYLTEAPRGIRLEIRDDILHVYSPGVSAADEDGFAATGDVVEVVGDRVLFRGRQSGVVNIGGSNVWPETVESILRTHPDVVEAVVSARPNPMTGNVLVAQVTLAAGADAEGVSKRLRSWVRDRAPRTHVPASVSVTDEVGISPTGKVTR
jgi:acyl-CoA synthetase (AMP-forming)/AMP-acid ligase II